MLGLEPAEHRGADPAVAPVSPSRWKLRCRCVHRGPAQLGSQIRRIAAAVRSWFSRRSATALQHLGRGARRALARAGHQRVEPAGAPVPNPPVDGLPRDPHPAARTGRCARGSSSRTIFPRSLVECASAASRINWYRNNPIAGPLGPHPRLIIADRHHAPPCCLVKPRQRTGSARSPPRQGRLVYRATRPARRQPATRDGDRGLGQRHRGQREPALDHGRDRGDHRHRIGEHPAGRIRHHRIRVHRAQPDGEHRPHRLGTLGKPPQPAAHRLPGRPKSAAIRRNPKPHRALAANADTITAAVSARRSSALTGNNTCVTPQPVHRDRRGHNCTGPSGPRTCRDLARPQPVSTELLSGHHNSPAASLRSTPSRSASTVTTAPPSANRRPSRSSGQRDNGRAVAYQ